MQKSYYYHLVTTSSLMSNTRWTLLALLGIWYATSCSTHQPVTSTVKDQLHIVFVIGDEEYRSEESMPMIARILKRELGAKISLCYSVDDKGIIDPNNQHHIEGLEALETADLMIMFTRFRQLPSDQLKYITDYAESGKPMVGFRTSTHAFWYLTAEGELDTTMNHLNKAWPTEVFGQQWITHHGHFDDGSYPLTEVDLADTDHPITKGVSPFQAYSWLYYVDVGDWQFYGDPHILLRGTSLKSNHEQHNRLDQFALTNPVAWTKEYGGAKVFFTTLGHPYDFKNDNMRKLVLNGIFWSLDLESTIPAEGVDPSIVGSYDPNNSGFGDRFKQGVVPVYKM